MNWKNYITIFVAILSFGTDAICQTIDRGPYLQTLSTESIFLKWRTDVETDSKVWYGDSPTNLNSSILISESVTDHDIQINGLSPNTTYFYAVGDSNGQMAGADSNHYFITAPTSPQTIRMWVLGDAGTHNNNQMAVRDAYYDFIGAEHTDMILLLGDNAYQDGTDAEYQSSWFENMYEDQLINSTMWPTFGNHDGRSANSVTQTGPYYDIFTLPKNAEAGGLSSGTEAYYSFDYGNVHVISLNSDDIDRSPGGAMLQWLEDDLNATNKDWIIAIFHHAPYTGEKNNESDVTLRAREMRENAVPILEAAGVDLVLGGHTHAYQRSYLIKGHYDASSTWDQDSMAIDLGDGRLDGDGAYLKNIGTPEGNKGTVYVVSGSAGKLDYDDYNHPVMSQNIEKLGSVVIEVNDLQMDVKFISSDSLVEDYFTIIKQGDPPSVNITSPLNNDYFDTPQSITIEANASDENGTVTQVEFFVDNNSIGVDNSSPYSMDWTIPSEGNFALKAIATDDEGNYSFSIVDIQVGPLSVCSKVNKSSDDAEEKASGNVSITSGDLELIHDGSDQIVGLRFTNLNIPQCAVIENAYIQFTVDETGNINPSNIQIFGEASDNAASFQTNSNNISNRLKTQTSVNWSPPDWSSTGENGQNQKTVDIAPVVQEIVDREGFTSNSSIVILMEGTGKRVAESYNGGSAKAPEICIEYKPIGPDDDNDGTCNANDLCPSGPEPGTSCDDGDHGTYNDVIDSNCNCTGILYDCPSIQANFGDSCDDNDPGTHDDVIDNNCNCAGIQYDCYPLPNDIGDICDDGDPGTYSDHIDTNCDCIGIPFDCPSLQANIGDSCDDGISNTVNDTIDVNCNCVGTYYDCPNVPGNIGDPCDDGNSDSVNDVIDSMCVCLGITTTSSKISHKNDDAEEKPSGSVSLTSSDLEMVVDGSNVQVIGLRFNNLNIPKGASIETAFVQFTVDQTDNQNPSNLDIYGEASDDALIFSNITNNITAREKTTNSVSWSPTNWNGVGDAGTAQQTDDIANIIQEIIDRDGYTSNSSIVIIIEGVGKRTAVSYDGDANEAPVLEVTFKCKDNDNDGVCDLCPNGSEPGAPCDDGDPTTYDETVDTNCDCIGISYDCPSLTANIGDPCDDGDPNTSNDVVDSNCNCSGSYDCPSIQANIGDPCDDGDPNTSNDLIDSNCNCVGTNFDCPTIQADIGDSCDDGNPNTSNDVIDSNCNCVGTYDCPSIPANIGDPCDDGNPETSNDMIDANCNCVGTYDCPSIPANIGDPCDDGDSETSNDVIDSNCNCVGTYDCPSFPANIGDSCDDGDTGTYNDIIDSNCDCVGIPYDCPSILANIGDPCDDGNPNTANDVINANCVCMGTYDCPSIPANIGDPCDDGNPNTSNDIVDSNCNCLGSYDCPSLSANIGDPCDDGITGTYNDSVDVNCNCIGIPYDCPNIPGNIGDPCDDGNPNSSNDVIDSNCFCQGTITTNASISQNSDDAEERTNGTVSLTSSDLEMIVDGTKIQTIGLRFENLNIPQGADIQYAYVQFTVDQTDNQNPSNLDIYGEVSDNATTFTSSGFDISNRTKTSQSVTWSPNNWQTVGETGADQQTINIAPVIQEIVDRPSFTINSAIAIIIEGEGKRTADSYDGDPNNAPEIVIIYTCTDDNNDGICDTCPGGPEPGESCDDGNPGTYNDTIDSNCNCVGTPYDCPSIQANIDDPCDDGIPGTSDDVITSNCTCEGTYDCPSIQANIGDPCDDGNPDTSDDIITSDCICEGTYDCPSLQANIGDSCDDGDGTTYNDLIDSNCNCVGTPFDCPSFPANIGDSCDDGNPETSNDVITTNCTCEGVYDCPAIQANIGDPCDDGNPNTSNDTIDMNCDCVGVYDCPSLQANIGDPCDDGDPGTFNDTIDANCDCIGSPFECPDIPGNIGDPCDDGNPDTSNDTIDPNCICHGIFSTNPSISQSSDDAEENDGGTVDLSSSDLEMTIDGADIQVIGLRFQNLNIPQGATIESAYIQFTVDQVDNIDPCNLNIYGEASDDASTFLSLNSNISNRPKTNTTTNWSPPAWQGVGSSGPDQKTSDISSIIQEIVDRDGFSINSSIVIIIEGNGKRTAESIEGDPNGAPELIISYTCLDDNNDGQCDTCPGGAEPGDSCDDADAGTYNDELDSNCDCIGLPYDCPTIQANIGDICDDNDSGTYDDIINSSCLCEGTTYDCPSIQANIGDPCDDGDSNTINDEIDSNCNCAGTPLISSQSCSTVNNSNDDAEEKVNGQVNTTSSDLEMVIDGGTTHMIGLRFTNLNIPKGAIINNAEIQFTADQVDNINPCNLEIFGEATDNALNFGGNFDISSRTKTSSSETWSPADWLSVGDAGSAQKTVNIASVIQEIVNRGGYTSNSAIVIIIEGEGKRTAESFNADPNLAPELCVDYFDPPQSMISNLNSSIVESENINHLNTNVDNNAIRLFKSTINIYPNPATDKLFVSFRAFSEEEVNIQVLDLNGRKLIEEQKAVNIGYNGFVLEHLTLKNGIYLIRLQYKGMVYTSKVTILY